MHARILEGGVIFVRRKEGGGERSFPRRATGRGKPVDTKGGNWKATTYLGLGTGRDGVKKKMKRIIRGGRAEVKK